MNLLGIVQSLHYEAKLPGSPPSTVAGLSGRGADLVRWAVEAWNDIQRDHDGRWNWLRRGFVLDTESAKSRYSYDEVNDEDDAEPITRFRAWELDARDPPFIYRVADGKSCETQMVLADWDLFRARYVRGTHEGAHPRVLAVDTQDRLHVGATPDGVYRITGNYWRSNQVLTLGEDEPEMPADFHMLIVWWAILRYGYDQVAQEILSKATTFGAGLHDALVLNQWYGRRSLSIAGALA